MGERGYPIGIDLGTIKSCVAVVKDGKSIVITNEHGHNITPSFVAFTESETLVGHEALKQVHLNPKIIISNFKRLIGRQFNDPRVQEDIKMWPFSVKKGQNGQSMIEIPRKEGKRLVYPEFCISLILKQIKEVSESFLEQEVYDAVITVPAYFNDAQRRTMQDAGRVAGLNVVKIIDEPTAAAIAYGIDKNFEKDKINILVYDYGDTSFDVTILTMEDGIFEVKSTNGNTHLGGKNFTNNLVNYCINDIKITRKKDITTDKTAMSYLRSSCIAAKKRLSSITDGRIILKHENFSYDKVVTPEFFFEINKELIKSTLKYVKYALRDANMKASDIDDVILIGGSTRIPKIQSILREMFVNKQSNRFINLHGFYFNSSTVNEQFKSFINPDEVVAVGAAMEAAKTLSMRNPDEAVALRVAMETARTSNFRNAVLFNVDTISNYWRIIMGESYYTLGIDLGTTNTCVAVYKDGKPIVITNELGHNITPSCVAFTESETLVGHEALKQMSLNPKNTIHDAKRLIGRQFNDPSVQKDIKMLPFPVKEGENGQSIIEIPGKKEKRLVYPEFISSIILKKMKNIAEKFLGQKVYDAVITVPAFFNEAQRRATQDAGRAAGLNVVRMIHEPTAAAIAYGIDKDFEEYKINILVYDLGVGTFDVTILTMDKGIFEVKSTNGNTHLGGQDFTNNLLNYCINDIKITTNEDITTDETGMAYLKSSCEAAMKTLASHNEATVTLEYERLIDEFNYVRAITLAEFEDLNEELFESTLQCVQDALKDANMRISYIDEVILVEESSKIPKIRSMLREMFINKPVHDSIDPSEVIAIGAAIDANK